MKINITLANRNAQRQLVHQHTTIISNELLPLTVYVCVYEIDITVVFIWKLLFIWRGLVSSTIPVLLRQNFIYNDEQRFAHYLYIQIYTV